MNLALRKIIYDLISYIHPQRVSLNNTPINNPVLRSITNEMIVLQYNLSVEHFNLNSSLIYYINNWIYFHCSVYSVVITFIEKGLQNADFFIRFLLC